MPRVVLNDESKTGHDFEIEHRQQKWWRTHAQHVTDNQSAAVTFTRQILIKFCINIHVVDIIFVDKIKRLTSPILV